MRFGGRSLSLVALLFGAAASLSMPSDGRAASGGVEQLLKSFDQVTMGGAGESQFGRIAKWVAPIRVKLAGPVSSSAKSVILETLKTFSELTSLDVALVDESKEGENILIDFGGRAGKWHCTLHPRLSNGSAMRYATIYIDRTDLDLRPSGVRILRRCVRHELMHALGFLGHTHSTDSILSYRHPNFDFTTWDELFVRTLYDPRLEVGTPRELALPVACEVISELLAARSAKTEESRAASPAATPVHPYCAEKRAEIANTSDARAQHRLAWAFKTGRGTPRDDAQAVEWFTLAAEQGFVPAQTDLGQLYDKGQGVPQDHETAVQWYRAAATQGSPHGQFLLGRAYDLGTGVEPDPATAVEWLRKAATLGHPYAEGMLGRMYRLGRGVDRDFGAAERWARKAAKKGDPLGQFELAVLYRDGDGVAMSSVEAYRWFALAAQRGDPRILVRSNDNLRDLKSSMTPAEIARAEKLVEESTPKALVRGD